METPDSGSTLIFYDKVTAANQLLKNYPCDFVIAIGDDKTDEDLFLF